MTASLLFDSPYRLIPRGHSRRSAREQKGVGSRIVQGGKKFNDFQQSLCGASFEADAKAGVWHITAP
jgi:hypothetical protein